MGNGNSLITVTLDKAQPAIFYTGDVLSGVVHFNIIERTKEIDEIYLSLLGDVGYTTTRTVRMQNGQVERQTDSHNIRILGQKFLLGRPSNLEQSGQDLKLNDATTTLEPGQYKYPFSIRLPEYLPPTLHPDDYPFVRYKIQVLIEKKWYHSNNRHYYPIRIYPRVNLLNISNALSSVKFSTKQKDITIKGILQRAGSIPGTQTMVTLDIYNPNRVSIKRVDVCFIQRYEIQQCRRRLELSRLSIPELTNTHDQHIQTQCPLTIPIGIPPSFSYQSKRAPSNVHVELFYDLKLEVKAKGFFTDFEMQIPVIVGTDSTEHSTVDSSLNTNTINLVAQDFYDDADDVPPPSYDSFNFNRTS